MLKKIYFNHKEVSKFTAKNGTEYRRCFLTDSVSQLVPDKISSDVNFVDVCIYLNTDDNTYKIGVYPSKEVK